MGWRKAGKGTFKVGHDFNKATVKYSADVKLENGLKVRTMIA